VVIVAENEAIRKGEIVTFYMLRTARGTEVMCDIDVT
jgi:hypothetical protein